MQGWSHGIVCLFGLFLLSPATWGWGTIGHRASGFIAEAYLTPHSQRVLSGLTKKQNLADISVWADSLRGQAEYRHTAPYHYDSVPQGVNYYDHLRRMPRAQVQQGGALHAILVAERELENPQVPMAQKEIALRFLVHFIGDLHQPFHSGRPEDKGGNSIRVNWFGFNGSLHSVWDTGILLEGHRDIFEQNFETDQSLLYAKRLMERYQGRYPHESTRDNPGAWLAESIQAREPAYDPAYKNNQELYLSRFIEIADQRVYLAGLRIADVLNRIFVNVPAPSSQMELLRNIESIIGRLETLIFLGPRQSTHPIEDWN